MYKIVRQTTLSTLVGKLFVKCHGPVWQAKAHYLFYFIYLEDGTSLVVDYKKSDRMGDAVKYEDHCF